MIVTSDPIAACRSRGVPREASATEVRSRSAIRALEVIRERGRFSTDAALFLLFNLLWQAVGDEKSPRDKGGTVHPL